MSLASKLAAHGGILLRGLLMGAADIVPGVSGGTVAFVTGIYDRLLAAISAVDAHWLRLLLAARWADAWRAVDGGFMLALIAGILLSIFTLARLISELLIDQPLLVWSFFLGLILGSALLLMRQVGQWKGAPLFTLLLGTTLAAFAAFAPGVALSPTGFGLFAAGFIAVCAMILPGISGSFILVLLGMYEPVLAAVRALNLASLFTFVCGGVCGLLVFARALHWLLLHHRSPTMGLLTGFLLGSLPVVWPWQLGRETAQTVLVLPAQYSAHTGQPSQLLACIGLMLLGGMLVWLVEWRWGARSH